MDEIVETAGTDARLLVDAGFPALMVENFGDVRQTQFCVHCGGPTETKDHAPSKVFLDHPYPLTKPTLPSCGECNNGFSDDEEYLSAFVECVVQEPRGGD